MATPLGLETLTTLSATEPLFANDEDRAQAVGRFRRIVGYFEPLEKPSTRYGDDPVPRHKDLVHASINRPTIREAPRPSLCHRPHSPPLGAGDYVQVILRDMEDGVVREDGSTQLGDMLSVALQMKG